jgi:hypothetical protein
LCWKQLKSLATPCCCCCCSLLLLLLLLLLLFLPCLQLCFFLLHWAACGFWFIALQEGHHEMTWVGQEAAIIQGKNTIDL